MLGPLTKESVLKEFGSAIRVVTAALLEATIDEGYGTKSRNDTGALLRRLEKKTGFPQLVVARLMQLASDQLGIAVATDLDTDVTTVFINGIPITRQNLDFFLNPNFRL